MNRTRATRLCDAMAAAGASPEACRHAYAGEVFVTPVREELRRLGYSGELAEDLLDRIAAMSREDLLSLWQAIAVRR